MITTTAILKHKYDSPSGNVSYVLFQPEHTFSFLEGQFCMIEAEIDGKIIKKPYSIASTNLMLQEEKLIGFVVKKASENGMSDFLTTKVSLGDQVVLKGALGHYVDPQIYKNYLFVSIGSGLSPNFGLFQHLIYESHQYTKIANILGERTSHELVPYIQERFLNHGCTNVQNFFCLSQEENQQPHCSQGYVQSKLVEAITYTGTDTSCFVCGAPAVVTDVVNQLIALGITKDQIVVEKY